MYYKDDAKDWEIGFLKVCDICSSATLAMGVASTTGDREGFLGPRPHPLMVMTNTFPPNQDLISNLEVQIPPEHNLPYPLF